MSDKITYEIEECIRNNIPWPNLSSHLKQNLQNNQKYYDRNTFKYSLRNQLRYRGNLVRKIFRNERRYYELMIDKSVTSLCLFPYHLADIVTKGLRVTPFNYYLDVLSHLLKNDKSYDTLPNFTAVDCLRVLGIGRNEYLAIISDLKTNSSKFFRKPNPLQFLPKFPSRISIEPWWKVEVGYVLEIDVLYVNQNERSLIDDLIDFGAQQAGLCDYNVIHSLYRKGLIYLDIPITGDDIIKIPPLKNFVMNRVSGEHFENLLYKIFITADEHITILELSQMLGVNLDAVKQAISLFCRLGFAMNKRMNEIINSDLHRSWKLREIEGKEIPQITPLNYHSLLLENPNSEAFPENDRSNSSINSTIEKSLKNSIESISLSDENTSDFSIINNSSSSPEKNDDISAQEYYNTNNLSPIKKDKRIGFLFDSTLTAFLMMGNLSPGLKTHAVTLFEVGKLCDENIDSFLKELEKVSLLDAEGEGEACRYFTIAVILRSTIIALRNYCELDLLRLECLETLDFQTRNRLLEKKYKYIISAAPLSGTVSNVYTVPFFGQFYKSSDCSHIWSKLFYYHMSGFGPPSLLLTKGTVLKSLPRIFLGYGKLLITVYHMDSYVINADNYKNINDQLKNGCVLVQAYGIREQAELKYEAFPIECSNKWYKHKAIDRLSKVLNLRNTFGFITFIKTGVSDIGCESYDTDVHLERPINKKDKKNFELSLAEHQMSYSELNTPMDGSEITSFKHNIGDKLKSPDENYFAVSPINKSPSNDYRSADCNELLAEELNELDECNSAKRYSNLVSQSSIEIPFDQASTFVKSANDPYEEEWTIMDLHFGIPLFDVDCNTKICQNIKNVVSEENLNNLTNINVEMEEKFINFISQCLYFKEENIGIVRSGKLLPKPRINLAFENGKVCYWNGK